LRLEVRGIRQIVQNLGVGGVVPQTGLASYIKASKVTSTYTFLFDGFEV